ncbi:MAG: hypothetical protein R2793_04100 [Flavobacteriaceae bacterium]
MTITVILHVILLLLLFYFGLKYLDPPPENGIAVNFGTTDFGKGNDLHGLLKQPLRLPLLTRN